MPQCKANFSRTKPKLFCSAQLWHPHRLEQLWPLLHDACLYLTQIDEVRRHRTVVIGDRAYLPELDAQHTLENPNERALHGGIQVSNALTHTARMQLPKQVAQDFRWPVGLSAVMSRHHQAADLGKLVCRRKMCARL